MTIPRRIRRMPQQQDVVRGLRELTKTVQGIDGLSGQGLFAQGVVAAKPVDPPKFMVVEMDEALGPSVDDDEYSERNATRLVWDSATDSFQRPTVEEQVRVVRDITHYTYEGNTYDGIVIPQRARLIVHYHEQSGGYVPVGAHNTAICVTNAGAGAYPAVGAIVFPIQFIEISQEGDISPIGDMAAPHAWAINVSLEDIEEGTVLVAWNVAGQWYVQFGGGGGSSTSAYVPFQATARIDPTDTVPDSPNAYELEYSGGSYETGDEIIVFPWDNNAFMLPGERGEAVLESGNVHRISNEVGLVRRGTPDADIADSGSGTVSLYDDTSQKISGHLDWGNGATKVSQGKESWWRWDRQQQLWLWAGGECE